MVQSKEKLEELKTLFAKEAAHDVIKTMCLAVTKELSEKNEYLHQAVAAYPFNQALQASFKDWQGYLEESLMFLSDWAGCDKQHLTQQKVYLAMDELMAEIDDWIEGFNEDQENFELSLTYMEAWDIGAFFEAQS